MSNKLEKVEPDSEAQAIERVLISGDLGKLTADQRVSYYQRVCASTGLNPLTNPFAYIKLNGKLVLYALKGCTDQLRAINGISIMIVGREQVGDVYTVTARATCKGRNDEDEGSVSTKGLHGEALANSHMKALTKAKRRVTLSLVGLGMLDETEAETIPGAVMHDAPVAKVPGRGATAVGQIVEPDSETTSKTGPRLEGYCTLVTNSGRADNVRVLLAEAESQLDVDEFQELQIVASEHLEFIGEES